MSSIERLKDITLFKELSDEERGAVALILEEAQYKKGSLIWEEGASEQGLHIIDYGKVRVYRKTMEGHKQVLALLKENRFYGELSALDGRNHSASVEAIADTKVFILRKEGMDKLLKERPLAAFKVLRAMTIDMSEILRQMNARFMDMVNYVWD